MTKSILTIVAVLMAAGGLQAKTWNVNPQGTGDAPTIQAAVDSAQSGDVVVIAAGTYHEVNILVEGKNIVISESGRVYLLAPVQGTGTGITFRNVSASGSLTSLSFSGYHTGISIENSSVSVTFVTVKQCIEGVVVAFGAGTSTLLGGLVDSCATGVDVQGATAMVQNWTIVFCTTGIKLTGGTTTVTRNIVSGCDVGVDCAGAPGALSCNDFFQNTTDYNGCSPGLTDFFTDPIFCYLTPPSPGLFWLHSSSPCWTKANPCNASIGAFVSGVGCTDAAVEETSWGAIKSLYR